MTDGRTCATRLFVLALLVGVHLAAGACSTGSPDLAPTRGVILISIDTLRADHVGTYGSGWDTTPFIDRLAGRGAVFENAVVQLPGTLPSHMSIFTGLYPAEHGVYPPEAKLSPAIETLPEAFARHGFRTAGFTEGGYVSGDYGFERGFEVFSDAATGRRDDVERTFASGLSFLRNLDSGERFFLFLHTYAVHDPYDPPEPYRSMFWDGDPPQVFRPTGPNLSAVNRGEQSVTPEQARYFQALYAGGIRYVDHVLERWFAEAGELGLLDDTTVVLTSDHGEEFLDHGMLVHEQIYHENLHVPLIVLHPEVSADTRIERLVESIDIAPSLYEIAGIRPLGNLSGRSLVPVLAGAESPPAEPRAAFAESHDGTRRAIYQQSDAGLFQLLRFRPWTEEGGTWISGSVTFDLHEPRLAFGGLSFHEPRKVQVFADGHLAGVLDLEPRWSDVEVPLPSSEGREGGRRRIELRADGCVSPSAVGDSPDRRCLSFRIRGLSLETTELYDVIADPAETRDLAGERGDLHRALVERLAATRFELVAAPDGGELGPELERRLRALGYIQ